MPKVFSNIPSRQSVRYTLKCHFKFVSKGIKTGLEILLLVRYITEGLFRRTEDHFVGLRSANALYFRYSFYFP